MRRLAALCWHAATARSTARLTHLIAARSFYSLSLPASGIYLNEQKEQELASAEVQRTTASLLEMQKLLKAKVRGGASSSDTTASSSGPGALSADPSTLIYTDPHSYAYAMERKNLALLSAFALGSDKWATLKTTPFLHYLYHGIFAIDVGRLDLECEWTALRRALSSLITRWNSCGWGMGHRLEEWSAGAD